MHSLSLAAGVLALAGSISAQLQGFNYGAQNADGACRTYDNFNTMFSRAKTLAEPGFTSARLYTSVQCGSDNAPIEAIKAAIDTQTNLLLGVWASAGQAVIDNEIIALKQAAQNWPAGVKARVKGISVGSEDLYRSSPQGQAAGSDVGANAAQIVSYIKQIRNALKGTALAGVKVGHVDTWTAWTLGENKPVIDAVDFLGHNGFPYFETTKVNTIANAKGQFYDGLGATESVAQGKPVWVTETGWPVRGPKSGNAVANAKNSKKYWNQVGCELFGNRNTFWYTLYDANTAQTSLSFAVVFPDAAQGSKFNLQCPA
ncbi:hypothetical protein LTR37_014221 [Vermiconidia calcicola]|uniref:Uncharacterized protein n=1 Tax=Vermiconidia calcicola TaxID=1690605 RepID=A0ACC3MU35_9PEZI|nr:hypothetical protein LTR37_014221 [Vermiconidia calcicola]